MFKFKNLGLGILILVFSCKSQEKTIENSIKKCIKNSINNNTQSSAKDMDFYQLITQVENILVDKNILTSKNKKGYKEVFKTILTNKNLKNHQSAFDEIYLLLDKKGFENTGYLVKSDILKDCPYRVLITEKNKYDTFLSDQVRIVSQLEYEGFNNKELLLELIAIINEDDFSKITYRAPIILLVYRNLKMLYGDW